MPRKTQNLCNNFSEFALWIRFELFNTEASPPPAPERPPLARAHPLPQIRFTDVFCWVRLGALRCALPPSLPLSLLLPPSRPLPRTLSLSLSARGGSLATWPTSAPLLHESTAFLRCVCVRARARVRASVRACVWKSQTVVVGCLGSLAFFLHPSHPHPHALNRHRAQSSARR